MSLVLHFRNLIEENADCFDEDVAAEIEVVKDDLLAMEKAAQNNAAVALLKFMHENWSDLDDHYNFLKLWIEGDFNKLRKYWGDDLNLPDEIFIGADPLFVPKGVEVYVVTRFVNGISLNGKEHLTDDKGNVLKFPSVESAEVFLRHKGINPELVDIEPLGE